MESLVSILRMSSFPLSLLKHRKVGGLHFCRIGRLSFSFCICKAKPAPVRSLSRTVAVLNLASDAVNAAAIGCAISAATVGGFMVLGAI